MDTHSMLISPDGQYRQELRLVLNVSEIAELYQVLAQFEKMDLSLPKVAKDLRVELWYMLIEIKEFNAYLKEGGKP